jgi:hypothetical protein
MCPAIQIALLFRLYGLGPPKLWILFRHLVVVLGQDISSSPDLDLHMHLCLMGLYLPLWLAWSSLPHVFHIYKVQK